MKFSRSIPFFTALLQTPHKNRKLVLKSFPRYVVDDLIEILYNIITGRVNIGQHATKLRKYKKQLLKIKNTKTKQARRKLILNQKGGIFPILPFLLPLIGSVASSAIGGVVSSAIRNRMESK